MKKGVEHLIVIIAGLIILAIILVAIAITSSAAASGGASLLDQVADKLGCARGDVWACIAG